MYPKWCHREYFHLRKWNIHKSEESFGFDIPLNINITELQSWTGTRWYGVWYFQTVWKKTIFFTVFSLRGEQSCHSLLCCSPALLITTTLLSQHLHLRWKFPPLLSQPCSHTPLAAELFSPAPQLLLSECIYVQLAHSPPDRPRLSLPPASHPCL